MGNKPNSQTEIDDLDALFAEARATRPEVPASLMESILADAAAAQAGHLGSIATESPRRGPFEVLIAALGGWPSLGGLVAASCVGLWVGINAPDLMLDTPGLQTLARTGSETTDYAAYETFDLATVLAEDLQ